MKISKNDVLKGVILLLLAVAVILDTIGQISVCRAALHDFELKNHFHLVAVWCNYAVILLVIVMVGYDVVMDWLSERKKLR